MGFFDSIVNAADSFSAKVSGNVDAMGINSQVAAKEKEMNDLFSQLGAAYYSIHKNDPDDACRNLVQLLMNKEAELAKLKSDLAAKKAETAAISYTQPGPAQNFGQPGQYQQPMNGQQMGGPMGQPMNNQPMGGQMGQPMNNQPMGGQMGQPMNSQPMGGQMGQPMNSQPMGGQMGQPMNNQPAGQFPQFFDKKDDAPAAPAPLGPLPSMNSSVDEPKKEEEKAEEPKTEGTKEDVTKPAEDTGSAAEEVKTDGKTCSKCGATGQTGMFCGSCGNKLD